MKNESLHPAPSFFLRQEKGKVVTGSKEDCSDFFTTPISVLLYIICY